MKSVSAKFHVSEHTLRYYDNIHLIPGIERDAQGRRVFTPDAVGWLQYILAFRETGMAIDDIRHYIALTEQGPASNEERMQMMVAQAKKIDEQVANLRQKQALIQRKIESYQAALAAPAQKAKKPYQKWV